MRVLVTNDDGINASGTAAPARGAHDHGWDVVVAAPAEEAGGTGAGLTAAGDLRRVAVERRELAGVPAYAVAAHRPAAPRRSPRCDRSPKTPVWRGEGGAQALPEQVKFAPVEQTHFGGS